MDSANVQTVCRLIDQIKPLLEGHNQAVQGAVLAHFVAVWLGGHHMGAKTAEIRNRLLDMHTTAVRAILTESEASE